MKNEHNLWTPFSYTYRFSYLQNVTTSAMHNLLIYVQTRNAVNLYKDKKLVYVILKEMGEYRV